MTIGLACDKVAHHSVLSHYNQANKVFEGKVLKVGKINKKAFSFEDQITGERAILVKFEILKNYKNTSIKEEVIIGVKNNIISDFELGVHYIIYANKDKDYDFLICNKALAKEDADSAKTEQFLFEIKPNYNGYLVEHSLSGEKWAEGLLVDGLPVGEWKYYAQSGELQIKGDYANGQKTGLWQHFFHTKDEDYRILNKIISGDYYQQTGSYQLLAISNSPSAKFQKKLEYLVGKDTIIEHFAYRQNTLEMRVHYHNGQKEGKEELFNEEGLCTRIYHFDKDRLEGRFFELFPLKQQKNAYLKIAGTYLAGKKKEEVHYYYENDQLIQTKKILEGGKLVE